MRKRGIYDDEDPTTFLNVDVDVISRSRLEPLVEALDDSILVLHVGPEGPRLQGAHFELRKGSYGKGADALIRGLVALIKKLPPKARRVWDEAKSREFNIGIQAALKPRVFELRLQPDTLDAVASIGGTIVVTVYAAELPRPKQVRVRTKAAR